MKVPAILDKVETRKDYTFKLVFMSQELSGEEGAQLFGLAHQFGWLTFAPQPEAVPEQAPARPGKTPSQRLRAALYVLWQEQGEPGKFQSFYEMSMEKIIARVRDKIDGIQPDQPPPEYDGDYPDKP